MASFIHNSSRAKPFSQSNGIFARTLSLSAIRCVTNSKQQAKGKTEGEQSQNQQSKQEEKKTGFLSKFTGKNAWKGGLLMLLGWFGMGGTFMVVTWGAPERGEDGEIIIDAYSDSPKPLAYIQRTWSGAKTFFQMVRDPTSEKLLPEPLKYPYVQPKYTLVLELTDLLLKPEWDLKMGWRFKKRPGLDYFLQQCAQNGFEVVIFTHESASVAFPLTVSMDPQGTIWHRLFKEDTRYSKGIHIKDLSCLNRDLSKVILVDVDRDSYKLNPRNGMALKKWDGKDDDRELIDLASFLHTVVTNKVEDVRSVMEYYNKFDDPMAVYREKQAELMKKQSDLQKLQLEESSRKSQMGRSPFIPSNFSRR